MSSQLLHRGPDSFGEWRDDIAWLAHRRLAILDLSSQGHQPMESPCRRYVMTYNGEVYNYLELRKELERLGCSFRGQSDTEVVLLACVTWGVESAVKRFEGMFALGLYDKENKTLWLARDPMGIKPLYYTQSGEKLAFSSELNSLLCLPWLKKDIDQDALFSYFRYACIPAPATILQGINKLSSGSLLKFSKQKVTINQFWNLAERTRELRQSHRTMVLADVVEELDVKLRK
ncbi:MAG: asparagine synthetase B, partial [Gammaproteobacteria bacterium]|nr:asparagine synthetase B [Gammaproteobacteria bacterium]